MPRLSVPRRTVAMILVRSLADGKETFRREPYNVVSLDYGDGSAIQTFVEPTCGRPLSPSERFEQYDEVRIYENVPPFPLTRIGY